MSSEGSASPRSTPFPPPAGNFGIGLCRRSETLVAQTLMWIRGVTNVLLLASNSIPTLRTHITIWATFVNMLPTSRQSTVSFAEAVELNPKYARALYEIGLIDEAKGASASEGCLG